MSTHRERDYRRKRAESDRFDPTFNELSLSNVTGRHLVGPLRPGTLDDDHNGVDVWDAEGRGVSLRTRTWDSWTRAPIQNTHPVLRVHNPSSNRTDLEKVLEERSLSRLFLGLCCHGDGCQHGQGCRQFVWWGLFDLDIFRQRVADVPVSDSWACTTRDGVENGQMIARFDMSAVPGILVASSGPLDETAVLRERHRREQRVTSPSAIAARFRQLMGTSASLT